jgi:hypothetical protein
MQSDSLTPERKRLLVRLMVVAGDEWPETVRVAAVRAVQATLAEHNPLRSEAPKDLLEQVKPLWGTRLCVEGGRGVTRRVRRPPQSLSDVW